MREESHLDDMRSAIRGDFERLAERRGGQELMRPHEDAEQAPAGEAQPTLEPESEPALEPELEESSGLEEGPGSEESPEVEAPRRSWVDRLLGR